MFRFLGHGHTYEKQALVQTNYTQGVAHVSNANPPVENLVLHGGRGSDTLTGGDGDDQLFGGRGHDTLFGGPGKGAIDGAKGQDVLLLNGLERNERGLKQPNAR